MVEESNLEDMARPIPKKRHDIFDRMNLMYYNKDYSNTFCWDQSDLQFKHTDLSTELNQKMIETNQRLRECNHGYCTDENNLLLVPISGYTDYRRNLITLKALETSGLLEPSYSSRQFSRLKKLLISHMNHTTCLKHQQNALSVYLTRMKNYCGQLCVSTERVQSRRLMEEQLKRLLKVCDLLTPVTEIDPGDKENVTQYENLASILRCTHEISLSNSKIVIQLLLLIMKMHLADASDVRFIKHQPFGTSFVQFVLHHVVEENFDFQQHLSLYHDTFVEFRNLFSLVKAIASGDEQNVIVLLNYGFRISLLPGEAVRELKLFSRSEILTPAQFTILEIMKRIEIQNIWSVENVIASEEQKNCFELVRLKLPELEISNGQLHNALHEERERLLQQGVDKGQCNNEFRKLERLVNMYANHFCGPHKRKLPISFFKYAWKIQYGLGEKE